MRNGKRMGATGTTKRARRAGVAAAALLVAAALGGAPSSSAAASAPLLQQETDTQYERARAALNRAEYARAVELLRSYRQEARNGRYVPESLYWEGFALSRMEGTRDLRQALDVLRRQLDEYPQAPTTADARALLARVHGELARRGDSESARWVYENTAESTRDRGREGADREEQETAREARRDEEKLAALQALMNMDSERAVPILERVVRNLSLIHI